MSVDDYKKWIEALSDAWINLDPENAVRLFSKDVEYYESVLNESCKSWEEVTRLWEVIPFNQKDVTFNFDIIISSDNLAVINWQVSRVLLPGEKKQEIDGIFVIRLNQEGLCNYFKQWETIK